ncbi:MAG: hypothetical protein ACR2JH_11495 [Solirubrobacteraceae bacterium]
MSPVVRGKWELPLAVAAVLIGWAAIPLLWLAYGTIRHGGVMSGTAGALAGADQLFYMDSIRQSAEHLLITDHFDLTSVSRCSCIRCTCTWIGEFAWTPDFLRRQLLADELMEGAHVPCSGPCRAESLRVRFVLTDCELPANLSRLLGPLVVDKRAFGCAAVYELRSGPSG